MKQLAAHDPESVALYNRELMSAYKQAAFEIFIAVLLLVAIQIAQIVLSNIARML
jgi:hypothetical protein